MYLQELPILDLNGDSDFRARATFGVALAALLLLLPFAVLNVASGQILTSIGSFGIMAFLATNVWLVSHGRCHQRLTVIGLVPAGMFFMIAVFRYDGIIGSVWCYPAVVACYCMLSERRAWFANFCILGIGLPMAFTSLPLNYSSLIAATLIALSVFSAILVRIIDRLHRQLQYELVRDSLTGLFNRQTLKPKLEEAIALHRTNNYAASILAIDVDHFKTINDTFGHDVGDKALMQLASIFTANLRVEDYAFRTGGEEFLVLLSESSEKEANCVAERLRREVEVAELISENNITVSIGVACYSADEDWSQWVKRADKHLYEAKRCGRNRVKLSEAGKVFPVTDNVSTARLA